MKPRILSVGRLSFPLAAAIAALLAAPAMNAASITWDANGTTAAQTDGAGAWLNTNQWWNGSTNVTWNSGDSAIFGNGGAGGTVTLASGTTVGSLTFKSFTGTYTLGTSGVTIVLNSGITLNSGSGAVSIISPITLGAAQSWLNNSSSLLTVGSDAINNAGYVLTIGGSGNTTVSGAFTGAGGLTKQDAGILTLSSASNSYTGSTTLNAGVLNLSGNGTIADSTGFIFNGGSLTLTNVDSTEGALNRVKDSAGITSNGGTITYANTSGSGLIYGETIGSVDLVRGQMNLVLTTDMVGGGGNIQTLTLSGLTRTGGNANTSVITFGSAGGLGATNVIKVNGIDTSTTGGQIIGPWATVGTPAGGQTDYAIYNSDGVNATVGLASTTLTAPGESGWGSSTTAYRVGGAETLTATRTAAALRYTGGALAINLGASTFNLETYGVLNGGSGLTISTTGSGGLTTPTGGGNLYLTTGTAAITVSAPIKDNGGAVTVVKSGTGVSAATSVLTLSSTTSNYSGGTVINGGRVAITADANLGAAAGGITFNGGELYITNSFSSARPVILNPAVGNQVLLQGNGNWTNSGALSGAGGINFKQNPNGGVSATLTNAGNSFTGALGIEANNGAITVTLSSLSDSVGAGNIVFGANSNTQTFAWNGGGPLTLSNRQIEFGGNGTATGQLTSTVGAINVLSAVTSSGTGAKTLVLGTTVAGSSIGNITDGSGSVNIRATNSNWSLTGTNTYSGITGPDNVTLTILGKDALPSASLISFDSTSGSAGAGSGRLNLRMDNAGTVSLGNQVNVQTKQTSGSITASWTIDVNNNGGGTTGSTLVLGKMNFASIADPRAGGYILNVSGGSGYGLQLGDVDLANNVGSGGGTGNASFQPGQGFNPTTAPLTITGTVRQNAASVASGVYTSQLVLWGTNAGNSISGDIMNPADFPGNVNAKALNIYKGSTGTWTLSGTNSYTAGTNIATGKLVFSGANSLPTTGTVALGANGILSLADGTARNQTVSALTLTSLAGLSFDWTGNNTGDQLTSTADITPTAGSRFAIDLNRSGTPGGSVTLLTGGASSTLSSSTFYLANATDYTATLSTPTADTLVVNGYAAQTALTTIYWQGNKLAGAATAGVDNAWALSDGTKSNWSSTTTAYTATPLTPGPTANVIFANGQAGKTQQSTVLGADVTINSLVIDDSTAVTIAGANGAALTLMSSLSTAGTVSGTPGSAITVTSNAHASNTAINSRVNLGSDQTWNVASGKTLTVGGEVSGGFSLTKADAGTVILNGTNTYSGDTTISAGTLQIGNNTAGTLGAGNYAGSIVNNGTLRIWSTAAQTLSGVISGSGDLNKSYSGTLTLAGANTYTGRSTFVPKNTGGFTVNVSSFNSVNGGTPLLASSSLGAPTTVSNGTIDIGGTAQAGVTLNYTGPGETTDRVLNVAWNGNSSQTISASGTGPLKFTSLFTLTPSAGTGSLILTGTGIGEIVQGFSTMQNSGLSKTGTGTWILSGASTYNKATAITGGTLVARNATALGSGGSTNVSVATNTGLTYNAASDAALSIGGTLAITGGASTVIGGSIGSSLTSAQISSAGNATATAANITVNIYGNTFSTTTDGTGTYTLVKGNGGANTLSTATGLTLGTVFNNTNFTVGALSKTTSTIDVAITQVSALSGGTYYVGGLVGAGNVWAASNGSTRSNFSASSGGVSQALVPGSAASVTVDSNSYATSTVLGADMSISGLTISDNTNNFALNADGYGLTIGSGGITKSNTTTRTATIASNLVLDASQTWSNSDTGNALVVSGIVTGANNLIVGGAGNTTVSGRLLTGAGTLTKSGAGILTLSSSNTYTGATAVNAGTLLVNGSTHTSSAVTVAAGTVAATPVAKLGGTGIIGGSVALTAELSLGDKNGGVLAPTAAASGTQLKVTGTTTFTSGSIFEWNMSATTPATDPGVVSNSGSYGQLAGTGAVTGSNAVFNIVLGAGNTFSDNFWNSDKSWTNVFTGAGATLNLSSIFASFGGSDVTTTGLVAGQGQFSFTTTSTLNWTAVPEPTSALVGLLVGAGLLRRRRN